MDGSKYTKISIHALREEGDRNAHRAGCPTGYFYPRPPRGGRPSKSPDAATIEDISIHALREEGDLRDLIIAQRKMISIHALREEGD